MGFAAETDDVVDGRARQARPQGPRSAGREPRRAATGPGSAPTRTRPRSWAPTGGDEAAAHRGRRPSSPRRCGTASQRCAGGVLTAWRCPAPVDSADHEHGLPLLVRIRHRGPPRQARRPDQRRRPGLDARAGPDSARRVRDARHHRRRVRLRRDHARTRATSTSPRSCATRSSRSATPTRKFGLDGYTCGVITAIQEQSADIAIGVDHALEEREEHSGDDLDHLGAGDQGMMFGYACRETDELMPLPIAMAHRLAKRLSDVRKAGVVPYLRPDGKSQVSVEYVDNKPVRVDTVLISAQHREEVDVETLLRPDIEAEVIDPVLREFPDLSTERRPRARQPDGPLRDRRAEGRHRPHRPQDHRRHVRRDGAARRRRVLGQGPDEGRPLRRLHGAVRREERRRRGPRRSLPAAGRLRDRHRAPRLADGRDVRHRDRRSRRSCRRPIWEIFDFRPAAIIRDLDLARPIYGETAAYGHFGRKEFPWEATDRVDALRSAVGA